MSIIALLVILVLVGFGLYLVQFIPLAPPFPTIIRAIVILLVVLWLLDAFFGLGTVGTLRMGHPLR